MGVYINPRNQPPAVRRGTNAIADVGSPRGNAIDRTAKGAASTAKRTTAVMAAGSGRSPVRPTEIARSTGSAGKNGIGGISPAKTKTAAAPCHAAGKRPAAPGAGPDRSAGVKRAKVRDKSEGI